MFRSRSDTNNLAEGCVGSVRDDNAVYYIMWWTQVHLLFLHITSVALQSPFHWFVDLSKLKKRPPAGLCLCGCNGLLFMKWIDGDLWPQGALPPLIHSCINPSLFRNAEISLRSPPILLLFSTDMCWYYAVECSHLSLCGFMSVVLPYTTNLFVNAIVSVMQRSRVTSAANVSCLITPGWRESGYNRASVWTLALFLKKGMGSDNTTAALLLKGSFCAAPSPTSCLRVVSPVGDWWGGGLFGGRSESSLPKLCQFLSVAEGKRAGQLLAMPSWGQTVWPGAAVRPCWTLCPAPLAQHTYYRNYPSTGDAHEKHTGGTVAGKKRGQEPLNSNNTSVQLSCVWMI